MLKIFVLLPCFKSRNLQKNAIVFVTISGIENKDKFISGSIVMKPEEQKRENWRILAQENELLWLSNILVYSMYFGP